MTKSIMIRSIIPVCDAMGNLIRYEFGPWFSHIRHDRKSIMWRKLKPLAWYAR